MLLSASCGAGGGRSFPDPGAGEVLLLDDGQADAPGLDAGPLARDAFLDASDAFDDAGRTPDSVVPDADMPDTADPVSEGGVPDYDAPSPPDAVVDEAPADLDTGNAWTFPPRETCPGTYGTPVSSKLIDDIQLREASGLAASPLNPEVVWTHNDSGGGSRLFAVRTDGTALGRLNIEGAPGGDWEDMAAGACPDGSGPCLWVEDHGSHKVYAIIEPVVSSASNFGEIGTSDYWTFQNIYPVGGGGDVEALLVEPDGSRFYLFEKTQGDRARIYSGVPSLDRVADVVLVEEGSVTSPGPLGVARDITGGDLHPSRSRLLLRTYLGIFEYRLHPGDFPGNLDAAERIDIMVPLTLEPSGEAVTYDHAGDGILTLSEGLLTIPFQPLHHFPCVENL